MRSYRIVQQMQEAKRLAKMGMPLAALNVLLPPMREEEQDGDYPWGGMVEPYDAFVESQL